MKNIIIVNASPRPKGNCHAIADRLAQKIEGADVKVVDFRKSDIGYCLACDACMRKDTVWCAQKDDMTALLPQIDTCDALVLLTPIYWNEVSAQAKTFIDRMYAFFNPMKPNMTVATKFGKKAAVVTTNGTASAEMFAEKSKAIAGGDFAVAGFTDSRVLAFNQINEAGSVMDREDYLQQIDELAVWLSE